MSYLEDLPFEIIDRIFENLCLHCNVPHGCQCGKGCLRIDPNRGRDSCLLECPPPEIKARICTLASLCLTSRHLRVAATPHLYHRPDTEKWWLLARTLLGHPHLADHVKRLCFVGIPFCEDSGPTLANPAGPADIAPEVWSSYAARLAAAQEAATASRTGYPDLQRIFNSDDGNGDDDNGGDENGGDGTLLATLCPATVVFEAIVCWPPVFYLSAPGSLPRLTMVELAVCNPAGGFTLSELAGLFRAAPNLQTLRCQRVYDTGRDGNMLEGVVSASLMYVEILRSVLGPGPLVFLFKACPRLETFRFGSRPGIYSVGEHQFHPVQARDTMFKLGTNLKRVEMEFEFCRVWRRPGDQDSNLWEPARLKKVEIDAFIESYRKKGMALELKLPIPRPRYS
ncbi:hypothetical protein C7999DRAFT_10954 [Corynascus novoguineensis]|uniref:Uncharacterized protein n=1 Tax=Corynascus novoguineensis TaxID=1126955 RepID=A0AAN7HU90_9PEZI|nr:hypothetical protein C7999DRAFT_10954 [Corynascus novoguineensis]